MDFENELKPYRGGYVDGVGGYKVGISLPPSLSRQARRADWVRRIRMIWYIKGAGPWKQPADHISLLTRLRDRLRGWRPQTDAESRSYWEARGGPGYDEEAFSAEWRESGRRALTSVWNRLSREGVDSIMEIGCGTGRNLVLFREMGKPNVLGLDFSLSQLRKSKERGFSVGQASAKTLPLRDKSVDVAIFLQVLIHVPPPIAPALEEAVRVARRFVILCEEIYDDVGLDSLPTSTPHCFRHNLVAHMQQAAPHAERIWPVGEDRTVQIYRL